MNEQIKEMMKDQCVFYGQCENCPVLPKSVDPYENCFIACEMLYNAGYRKQSEGEWREDVVAFCNVCSSCRAMVDRYAIKCNSGKLHYCPNCGAKMKGGAE